MNVATAEILEHECDAIAVALDAMVRMMLVTFTLRRISYSELQLADFVRRRVLLGKRLDHHADSWSLLRCARRTIVRGERAMTSPCS